MITSFKIFHGNAKKLGFQSERLGGNAVLDFSYHRDIYRMIRLLKKLAVHPKTVNFFFLEKLNKESLSGTINKFVKL